MSGEQQASIESILYRDVWLKDDSKLREEALALGRRMATPGTDLPPDFWTRGLCVVAYDGHELVSMSTAEIRFSQRLRTNMAYLRVVVVPEYRQRGIVVPLTVKTHDVLRQFSLAHPEKRIGGTMAVVTVRGVLDEPVTKAFMVLIGYTPRDEPVIVRWFDHHMLPL